MKTDLFRKGKKESLPEDSPYYPAREVLEPFLNGEQFISQQNSKHVHLVLHSSADLNASVAIHVCEACHR